MEGLKDSRSIAGLIANNSDFASKVESALEKIDEKKVGDVVVSDRSNVWAQVDSGDEVKFIGGVTPELLKEVIGEEVPDAFMKLSGINLVEVNGERKLIGANFLTGSYSPSRLPADAPLAIMPNQAMHTTLNGSKVDKATMQELKGKTLTVDSKSSYPQSISYTDDSGKRVTRVQEVKIYKLSM